MKEEHFNWLHEPKHKLFMYTSQFITRDEKKYLYVIYNELTGENKRPSSCGKCITTTLKMLKYHYEKQIKLKEDNGRI